MQQSLTVIKIVVPVFLALFFGYFSRQKKIISKEGIAGMRTFIVNFALPVALFRAVGSISYSSDTLVLVVVIFLACAVAFSLGFVLLKLFPKSPRMLPFLITCTESGMIGLALFALLFGIENLPFIAQIGLGCDIFVFTIYSIILRSRDGKGGVLKEVIHNMVTSPIFIGIFLGIIAGTSGLYALVMKTGAGMVLGGVFELFASPITFVMLFVVGYSIKVYKSTIKQVLLTSITRILVMGALCAGVILLLNQLITLDRRTMWAIILLFSLPGPYILPVLASREEDRSFASTALSFHMLISTGIFFVIATLAAG